MPNWLTLFMSIVAAGRPEGSISHHSSVFGKIYILFNFHTKLYDIRSILQQNEYHMCRTR